MANPSGPAGKQLGPAARLPPPTPAAISRRLTPNAQSKAACGWESTRTDQPAGARRGERGSGLPLSHSHRARERPLNPTLPLMTAASQLLGHEEGGDGGGFVSVPQSFLLTGGPAPGSRQDPGTHLLELNEPLGE